MVEHHNKSKRHFEWTEDELRLVRTGWYNKHDYYLTDQTLEDLTDAQRVYYMHYRKPLSEKLSEGFKTFISGFGVVLGLIAFYSAFWWLPSSINWLNGDGFVMNAPKPSSSPVSSTSPLPIYSPTPSVEPTYSDYSSDDGCNENYDPCVEDSAYDLDCADIGEEVEVIGYDEYNLDRDGDGWGCESY